MLGPALLSPREAQISRNPAVDRADRLSAQKEPQAARTLPARLRGDTLRRCREAMPPSLCDAHRLLAAHSLGRPSPEKRFDPGEDESRRGERCEQGGLGHLFSGGEARELALDEIKLVLDRGEIGAGLVGLAQG
jgi:hypothetical protein